MWLCEFEGRISSMNITAMISARVELYVFGIAVLNLICVLF
jgi:hypothetical protein